MKFTKCLTLILAFYSSISLAETVTCSTDGSGTQCSSADISASNIKNESPTGTSPISSIVVSSPSTDVTLQNSSNTKPIKTNLFLSNPGSGTNVNIDLSGKWDTNLSTYGQTAAPNSGTTLVVADNISNLSLNVSGYVGKSGNNASVLCANKILAGDYGTAASDQFKTRCNDGTTGSPCPPAKVRTACDSADITNLNTESGTTDFGGYCPVGYTYHTGNDDIPLPTVSATKVAPAWVQKCTGGGFFTQKKECKYRTVTCSYSFGISDFSNWLKAGTSSGIFWDNTANQRVLSASLIINGQNWPINVTYPNPGCHGCADYATGSATVVLKDSSFSSTDNTTPSTVLCPKIALVKDYYGTRWATDNEPNGFDGHVDYSTGSCSNTDCANLTTMGTGTLNTNQIRYVSPSVSCSAGEAEGALVNDQFVPSETAYINQTDTCPSGELQAWGSQGLTNSHGRTDSETTIVGTTLNFTTTEIQSACSQLSCGSILTSYSTSSHTKNQGLILGGGESGSNGGKANIFTYDILGSESYIYSNGSNGINGANDLSVNTIEKNCYKLNGNMTSYANVNFHKTTWKLFDFTASTVSHSGTFPSRTESDAISVNKKVSPGVRDLIKQHVCPTCP